MPDSTDSLTREEAKGIRIAMIFGTPDPEPALLTSAKRKLLAIENAPLVPAPPPPLKTSRGD